MIVFCDASALVKARRNSAGDLAIASDDIRLSKAARVLGLDAP